MGNPFEGLHLTQYVCFLFDYLILYHRMRWIQLSKDF